jgi:hypothetical protein
MNIAISVSTRPQICTADVINVIRMQTTGCAENLWYDTEDVSIQHYRHQHMNNYCMVMSRSGMRQIACCGQIPTSVTPYLSTVALSIAQIDSEHLNNRYTEALCVD